VSRTSHRRTAKRASGPLVSRSKTRCVTVEWVPGPATPAPSLERTRHGEPRFTTAAEQATRATLERAGIAFGGRSQWGIGQGYQASVFPDSIWIQGTPCPAMRDLRHKLSALLGKSASRKDEA
jgi:hypothetical protein